MILGALCRIVVFLHLPKQEGDFVANDTRAQSRTIGHVIHIAVMDITPKKDLAV
jgi:hypothetical protein